MNRKTLYLIYLIQAIVGFLLASASAPVVYAQAGAADGNQAPREYQIKLGFLFNFIKYVDWPGGKTNVSIGVLGRNPFGSSLSALNGKVANGKTLTVRSIASTQDARNVDVLFISASEADRLRQIIESLKGQPVLTVGEISGFCQSDGIINFTSEGNKIRFQINPDAAGRADLKISSNLLRLAKVVRE